MTVTHRPSWREPANTVVIDVNLHGIDIKKATEKWRSKIAKRKHSIPEAAPQGPVSFDGSTPVEPPHDSPASLDIQL